MLGWLLLGLLILLVGLGGIGWYLRRSPRERPPPPGVTEQGYGQERWAREAALWRGILRRLEIQARHSPPSEGLRQQLEEARAKIAEAEKQKRAG